MIKKAACQSICANPIFIAIGLCLLIINSLFKCFLPVFLFNWHIALLVCTCICFTTIVSNFMEYNNNDYSKGYLLWELAYPISFFGSVLTLLWFCFIITDTSLIWIALSACWLVMTVCMEIYLSARYDHEQ